MKRLAWSCFLPFITILAWGQSTSQIKYFGQPDSTDAVVRSFYAQVVARHPLGIPYGADMEVFGPYLSKHLHHELALSDACFKDWKRKNPDPSLKPTIGLIENGIFSWGDVRAEPKSFQIEKSEREKSSSTRVFVKLIWGDPLDTPVVWHVAVMVVREKEENRGT